MKLNDILHKLPSSWEDFKFGDYLKTLEVTIDESGDSFAGLNNSLNVVSAITDIPVEELEQLPLNDVQVIGKRLSFITELPKDFKGKASLQFKSISEITYNDFTTYLGYADNVLPNLPILLKTFSKSPISEEQIKSLSVAEVYHYFFILKKIALKSLRHSTRLQAVKIMKLGMKDLKELISKKFRNKRKK